MTEATVAQATWTTDARGSFCPGPLMELIRGMKESEVGDVLAVRSTDEGSKTDTTTRPSRQSPTWSGTWARSRSTRRTGTRFRRVAYNCDGPAWTVALRAPFTPALGFADPGIGREPTIAA